MSIDLVFVDHERLYSQLKFCSYATYTDIDAFFVPQVFVLCLMNW